MSEVKKEGWLIKQGKVVKNWKKRWFVLDGYSLSYHEKAGKKSLGTIDLSKANKVVESDSKKENSFQIIIPNVRTYWLVADSKKECEDWMNTIKEVIEPNGSSEFPEKETPTAPPTGVSLDDFTIIRVIGVGSFGKVFLVKFNHNGKLYAMKSMRKQILEESDQVRATLIERNILLEIKHPFLVSAHFAFQTPEKVFLVLDYVNGGDLFMHIKNEEKFSESRARLYAAEIALGLGHLHHLGYVYRDIKSDNILVDSDGHIKITDFGLTKSQMRSPNDTTTTFCGTPDYIAPEVILEKPYTKDVDWWGFGALVYEMMTGITPFYDDNPNTMYSDIVSVEPDFPSNMSVRAKNFISRLLVKNPEERLGHGAEDVEAVKNDPFFEGLNWDDVFNRKIRPEWIPEIESELDTSNFDPRYTEQNASVSFDPGNITEETQATLQGFTFTAPDNVD